MAHNMLEGSLMAYNRIFVEKFKSTEKILGRRGGTTPWLWGHEMQ